MSAQSDNNSRRRFWIWAVVFILVMALLGGSWGWVSSRAFGTDPDRPAPASAGAGAATVERGERCCSEDVKRFARRAAKRFRAGKIRRDRGFRPGAVYRSPRAARRVWVRKIHRYLLAHPGHLRALEPRQVGGRTCYPAQKCYAQGLYGDTASRASCVTGSYPAVTQGACERAPWRNGPGLTKKQVQNLGSVVLCGGGVVLGVTSAPPTRGGSVLFVAFWGALTCGWSFWAAIDPPGGGGGSWRAVAARTVEDGRWGR